MILKMLSHIQHFSIFTIEIDFENVNSWKMGNSAHLVWLPIFYVNYSSVGAW